MPPKIGAMFMTVSTISSTSCVARQIGKASTLPNSLKSIDFALHHRYRSLRPDVAETEHRAAVGDDGNRVALDGEVAHAAWILGDGHADSRHPGRVHHRQVVARPDRVSRRHLDLAAEVREKRAVRVFEHLDAGHARHTLDELLGVVGVGGEHGDVADDPVALDTNDVERADVAAEAADRRGELAEHPRPVHDAAARGEGEARGRMLDHGAAHLDARGRPFSVPRTLSPWSNRRYCPPGRRTAPAMGRREISVGGMTTRASHRNRLVEGRLEVRNLRVDRRTRLAVVGLADAAWNAARLFVDEPVVAHVGHQLSQSSSRTAACRSP